MSDWASSLRHAAHFGNVAAKISGLNTILETTAWNGGHFREAVEVALDCFGPDRLMCGSDWPVSLLNGDYPKVWRETTGIITTVAGAEAAQRILGVNPARLYRMTDMVSATTNPEPGDAHGRTH